MTLKMTKKSVHFTLSFLAAGDALNPLKYKQYAIAPRHTPASVPPPPPDRSTSEPESSPLPDPPGKGDATLFLLVVLEAE
ncbi:hypothetical protein E2C01_011774 [Portunus trituberculatus]|uniref:Uncharacterized protein n=1 Tax=Portunus trituberculatus TaxID=210409 RepID=A0A5B7DCD2_PORTR|nr:hypothetical protein [Portunus trituberculatus]